MSTFTTSTGQRIKLRPINPWVLAELERSAERAYGKPMPSVPTYTVTTATGATETHPHNETTLTTDAERAEYAAYLAAKSAWDAFVSERQLRAILAEGVVVETIPPEWERRMKFLGIPVPEEAEEKALLYVRTGVVTSVDDINGLMAAVMKLSGVAEEDLATAQATFRGEVEKADRHAGDGTADAEGRVVSQPAVHGNKNGARLGKGPKRV